MAVVSQIIIQLEQEPPKPPYALIPRTVLLSRARLCRRIDLVHSPSCGRPTSVPHLIADSGQSISDHSRGNGLSVGQLLRNSGPHLLDRPQPHTDMKPIENGAPLFASCAAYDGTKSISSVRQRCDWDTRHPAIVLKGRSQKRRRITSALCDPGKPGPQPGTWLRAACYNVMAIHSG
jgi:hypothetical protein